MNLKNFTIITSMVLVVSCAQFDKWKTPASGSTKNVKSSKPVYLDPKAESGPTTGHSYYNVPSSAPKMEKKLKSAKNATNKTPATKKKVLK